MEAFENLTVPRDGRAERHYFGEVLFIALDAMVCGMEDFERFAQEREEWRIFAPVLISGSGNEMNWCAFR